MSVVFNLTGHRALWGWLAENPDKSKGDWPGWKMNGGSYENEELLCFACAYTEDNKLGCDKCPLVGWGNDGIFCVGANERNLFGRWMHGTLAVRAEMAAKIRDLPVREGVEYE